MKPSRLALAAALTAVWIALPLAARAQDDDHDEEETVEIHKRSRRDDRGGRGGDRGGDRGDRGGRHDRRGGMIRESGDGHHDEQDPELRDKLDKLRELETKSHDLATTVRTGTDAEKAAAKPELRKAIGELFDAKLALETVMLARMEKQAAAMKTKLAKRKAAREKAIETRFLRMSGEGDEWD